MRIGHGIDFHKLTQNRDLFLGGVKIPHTLGLLGHSDADVLLHAIMDSVLGAAAKRDIGFHFPDTDQKYKGISSIKLLEYTKEIITPYKIVNIDATVIAQKPKLSPYIEQMRENIAKALDIPVDSVNVKATTSEGMGYCGREEGIEAHCVCLIQ